MQNQTTGIAQMQYCLDIAIVWVAAEIRVVEALCLALFVVAGGCMIDVEHEVEMQI
jgi:ABC-type methionine transport system ATPase subunit